jgi:hypothetical protein
LPDIIRVRREMRTGFWWGNLKESLLGRLDVGEYNIKVYLK